MQDAFDALELTDGTELEGYTIESPLSAGAMGAVYRAHRTEDGTPVAVKRLLDTRHVARFEIEARLLSTLSHPGVVNVLDYFTHPTGVYLVMAMVKGKDLGVVLKERGGPGLPIGDAIEYTRQACEALQYVHEQQIVHRDVKPANLIDAADPAGIVVVDFGVARQMGEEEQVDAGTVGIGTPRYMAPEVFAGGTVSARSDVFSLAATLWTLLTGKPPVYGDPAKLTEICTGAGDQLEATIRGGLELLPERRTSSCAAFAHALGAPLEGTRGESLVQTAADRSEAEAQMLSAIVKAAAGVFEAAACSVALVDPVTGELVYQAAWGAGAKEIVGVRLPLGKGLAGSAVAAGSGLAIPDCRTDARFQAQIAAGTGYVPYTMLVIPLRQGTRAIGALSVLDRRDGNPYTSADIPRGDLFAELAVTALGIQQDRSDAIARDDAPVVAPIVDERPSIADQGTVVG